MTLMATITLIALAVALLGLAVDAVVDIVEKYGPHAVFWSVVLLIPAGVLAVLRWRKERRR